MDLKMLRLVGVKRKIASIYNPGVKRGIIFQEVFSLRAVNLAIGEYVVTCFIRDKAIVGAALICIAVGEKRCLL